MVGAPDVQGARLSVVVDQSWRADGAGRDDPRGRSGPRDHPHRRGHPAGPDGRRPLVVARSPPNGRAVRSRRCRRAGCPARANCGRGRWRPAVPEADRYLLGLDPHAPDTHSPLASALMRVGIAPTLIGTRGGSPGASDQRPSQAIAPGRERGGTARRRRRVGRSGLGFSGSDASLVVSGSRFARPTQGCEIVRCPRGEGTPAYLDFTGIARNFPDRPVILPAGRSPAGADIRDGA